MTVVLREARADDAETLGRICYEAFKAIAEAHNYTPDFPSAEFATAVMSMLIGTGGVHGVAAEVDGRLVGSNFLDERGPIAGLGPITVAPGDQNRGLGAQLMGTVMDRGHAGVRLLQAAYHGRSLSLYLKLGFEAREPISCLQGPAIGGETPGCAVRAATADDIGACDALCRTPCMATTATPRLAGAIAQGGATVVERAGAHHRLRHGDRVLRSRRGRSQRRPQGADRGRPGVWRPGLPGPLPVTAR